MCRETRIGLLVSLGFVVVFGLVLAELTGLEPAGPSGAPPTAAAVTDENYSHAYPIEELRMPAPRAPRPTPGRGVQPVPAPAPQAAASRRQPQPQPQPVVDARRPADRQYTVVPHDTLIGIARKVYGQGRDNEYRRILDANRRVLTSPTALKVGQTLVIPALAGATPSRAAEAPAAAPAATSGAPVADRAAASRAPAAAMIRSQSVPEPSGRIHTVEPNETLQEIAWKYYGDDSGAAVQKIINANPRLEGLSSFPAGMRIVIPR